MSARYEKTLAATHGDAGQRLDKFLGGRLDDVSRTQLTKWIRQGEVTINGEQRKPNFLLKGGERIEINGAFEAQQSWDEAIAVSFEILYEDSDLIVINKPAGLVVHPGAATVDPTLANGLLSYRPELQNLPRAGIVHRLDKDTTGVMVVAASEKARVKLTDALSKREVSRSYMALVEGQMREPRTVDLPLGRNPKIRTRQSVLQTGGRDALTYLYPREIFRAHTFIEARLETGRTHQIRVHASHIGLPIVGDRKYGAKRRLPQGASDETQQVLRTFPRQALHAFELQFEHPNSGEPLKFTAPMPDDMLRLIKQLQIDAKNKES